VRGDVFLSECAEVPTDRAMGQTKTKTKTERGESQTNNRNNNFFAGNVANDDTEKRGL